MINFIFPIVLLILSNVHVAWAQATNRFETEAKAQEIIDEIRFDKTRTEWKLKDIFELEPKEEIDQLPEPFKPRDYTLSNSITYLLAIILVAVLLFIIFTNMKIKKSAEVKTEAIIEDDIVAFKPKTALEQAIEAGDYRMAIRYRFLHALKNINEKELISWAFEKTNRDYLREFRNHRLFNDFRHLVNTYEMVWYGNTEIDQKSFEYLNKDFEFFLKQEL